MESAAALTVFDLRSRAVTNWVQDVMLHVPFQRGPPMEVHLNGGIVSAFTAYVQRLVNLRAKLR